MYFRPLEVAGMSVLDPTKLDTCDTAFEAMFEFTIEFDWGLLDSIKSALRSVVRSSSDTWL